ncbi:MAG TPA: hypothetical protein VKN99_23290 [Polyangia bacterium]|nr:hypothetical protein [Polyangia bacterium]
MRVPMFRALIFLVAGLLILGAACDTVDLGPLPADVNACRPSQQFFLDHVWPEFLAKDYGGKHCYDANCHDAASRQALTIPPPTSPPMVPLPPDWAMVYRSATEQTQCTNAEASALVTHPDGQVTHGGGMLISPTGPEVTIVKMWVTAP